MRRSCLLAIAISLALPGLSAEAQAPPPLGAGRPAARPADVETIDGLMKAVYESISGTPPGGKRDWDRMRSLFPVDAHLEMLVPMRDSTFSLLRTSIDDYIAKTAAFLEQIKFYEYEIARREEVWGQIAIVWSAYRGFRDGKPDHVVQGINALKLVHDGRRWWVADVFYAQERPDLPLPQGNLPIIR